MKIFQSIKWRLQIWYGLILVVVLAGFGFTSYQLERGRLFGRVESELNRRAEVLAWVLHRRPPRRLEGGEQPFDRPLPGQFPDAALPGGKNPRLPLEFRLPPEDAHFFETNDANHFYYVIHSRDGRVLARTADAGLEPATGNNYRQVNDELPSGEQIEVGCSIVPELKELHHIALKLTGIGGIILIFGLAGGWWLVSRALRPISEISTTAAKISSGDLSQRISVGETESELGQLAAVLNSTFARLETAFAQQKQFAADAAHELRTPVSVILTQTQMALAREREAASYRQIVEACGRAAQRMRRLIESLLELARFDAGQEVLASGRFDLAQTVSDSAELVQPLAAERGVKIIAELAPLEITGDAGRLAQVVTNLLTNAIQYNQAGGEVRVELKSENSLAVLKISDTGQGIAPEDLPRVFERFYRADRSRTGAGNAGLGLSICKAIVEAHGGTIEAASTPGGGSTFTVRLPV